MTQQSARKPIDDETVVRPIHADAMEHLSYIRQTMESSTEFTSVSGFGVMLMGGIAIATALIASIAGTWPEPLTIWLWSLPVAVVVGGTSMIYKARNDGVSLSGGVGRRFVIALCPPVIAAALITGALIQTDAVTLIPALWLLLYGAGIITGGAYSVPAVRHMGLCFMSLGAITLFVDPHYSNVLLAAGFGACHLAFGAVIWKRHGG